MTTDNTDREEAPREDDPRGNYIDGFRDGWKAHFDTTKPAAPSLIAEQEPRLLTAEELADIERFQRQRRKSPVASDAWLYVAEIDRLLTHIRLEREQLENEIFQDATNPNFAATPPAATAAARECAAELERGNWLLSDITPEEREQVAVIISKYTVTVTSGAREAANAAATEICPVCKDEVPADSMYSYNNVPNAFCQDCVDSGKV